MALPDPGLEIDPSCTPERSKRTWMAPVISAVRAAALPRSSSGLSAVAGPKNS